MAVSVAAASERVTSRLRDPELFRDDLFVAGAWAPSADGARIEPGRPDTNGWTVAGHGGSVTVRYKVFGDRVDGTYLAIDSSHAHINMPAAIMWARGLEERSARLAFERTRAMHQQNLVSDQAYDEAEAAWKVSQASVEAQRRRILQQAAVVATNRDDLEKTTVVSPMDGVITSLQKEEGEVVIGAQSFSPTVIMTVADLSTMEVEVLVDETDIRNLSLGQDAVVRVDALQDLKIKGQVTEIGSSAIARGTGTATITAATTANQAKDFKVVVRLHDPPANLRPGLNATAEITTARKPGVLAVPIQAVVVREVNPQGKVIDPAAVQASTDDPTQDTRQAKKGEEKEGVFVVRNGIVEFQPIKTGIMGETELEVTEHVQNDRIRLLADDHHGTVWDTLFTVVDADDGSTILTMTMDATSKTWLARIMVFLVAGMVRKAVERDMDGVKAFCEGAVADSARPG